MHYCSWNKTKLYSDFRWTYLQSHLSYFLLTGESLCTTQSVRRIQGLKNCWFIFYIRFLFVRFTDAKTILGSQQLLMNLIANKKLDMKELNSFSLDKLKSVMLSAGFEKCDINQLSYSIKYYQLCLIIYILTQAQVQAV